MNPYRQLPSLDRLLDEPDVQEVFTEFGRTAVRDAGRRLLDQARAEIAAGEPPAELPALAARLVTQLRRDLAPTLLPVINATGIVIHTNLGRAPLSEAARQAMLAVAAGYSNLEYDLEAGGRGSRYVHAERLLCELTGAGAALVVNNNAAAVTLLLRTIATGREVVISRGELVEIGGGFRMPDILQQSGARLVEVGTTNRTRLADYETALTSDTAALLKVHQSNFRIVGFTEAVTLGELVGLARTQRLPPAVLDDLGSGTLIDTTPYGLTYEITVQDSVSAGATATMFSGDKLLGGPQAGIILGDKDLIAELRRQPLTRALRVDKATLAALQATLLAYLRGTALTEIPIWQMIAVTPEALETRALSWAAVLRREGLVVETRPGQSAVGGGSLPGQTLPTTLLALRSAQPDRLVSFLRHGDPPVIARIEEDRALLDPRTVLPAQDEPLLAALVAAWKSV